MNQTREKFESLSRLPAKLDIYSNAFDPVWALNTRMPLPFPRAKTYNNLAEYYSHTFLRADEKKRAEKERPYDRNFSYYYATLGMDEGAQWRYEQFKTRKPKKYCGWRTAKLRKYATNPDDRNRQPCRSYIPLQSTKVIQIESPFTKYKIIPKKVSSEEKSDATFTSKIKEILDSCKTSLNESNNSQDKSTLKNLNNVNDKNLSTLKADKVSEFNNRQILSYNSVTHWDQNHFHKQDLNKSFKRNKQNENVMPL